MADGVPEVQERARTPVSCSSSRTTRIFAVTAAHHVAKDGAVAGAMSALRLEQIEERRVACERSHLREPAARWRSGRVMRVLEVENDAGGLEERAEEVLAGRVIEAGLASHRGVDHGEERRRDLHASHAAGSRVEAANPARSPTTPPPNASITALRSTPAASALFQIRSPTRASCSSLARGDDARARCRRARCRARRRAPR